MTEQVKLVYRFGKDSQGVNVTEGAASMKGVLGGKGANLAEMANIGLPVPPGFTITCQTCMEYANAGNVWPDGALDEIRAYRVDLEERMGKKIGDASDPLLVSVRSGAPMSMPGMMDTTTPVSHGTRTAASSRCSPTWSSGSTGTCSITPSSP